MNGTDNLILAMHHAAIRRNRSTVLQSYVTGLLAGVELMLDRLPEHERGEIRDFIALVREHQP